MTTRSSCAPRRTSTVEPSGLRTSTSHVAPFSESRSTALACPPGTSFSAAALAVSASGPPSLPSPSSPPTALATPTPPSASASAAPPARIAFLEFVMERVLRGRDESRMRWREQDSNLRRLSQRIYSPSPLTARESRPRTAGILARGGPGGPPRVKRVSARVAEALRLGERLELLERVVLDLADALARDVKRAPHLLERVRAGAREPEAHLDDLALALREGVERLAHVLLAQVRRRRLERRLGRLVLDEVAELGLLLLADRLLQRDGLLGHAQDLAHLARGALELAGDLLGARLAAELLDELTLDVDHLVELLHHVNGDADGPPLVRDRACDRLADPPRRVGRELVAAPVVELLDGADEAQRALLDEVE